VNNQKAHHLGGTVIPGLERIEGWG
jgi:hypothetical protein